MTHEHGRFEFEIGVEDVIGDAFRDLTFEDGSPRDPRWVEALTEVARLAHETPDATETEIVQGYEVRVADSDLLSLKTNLDLTSLAQGVVRVVGQYREIGVGIKFDAQRSSPTNFTRLGMRRAH